MVKKIKRLLLVFVLFNAFSLNVEATNKYQSGDCIYNFTGSLNGKTGALSIKITQDKSGDITYYYFEGESLNKADDEKWVEEKTGFFGYHIDKDEDASFWNTKGTAHYSTCPKYAYFKNVSTGKKIYFSDNENEEGYVTKTSAIESSKISSVTVPVDIDKLEDLKIIKDKNIIKYSNCKDVIGDEFAKMLQNIVTLGRIIIPILLNVYGVIDFGGAIFAGDEEKMKKAQKKFITRLLIGVVIFLLPSILKVILGVAHNIWPVIDNSLCGILG